MSIFKTLHFRIPSLVLLVGLGLIAHGYVRSVRWRVERRMEFLRDDAHAEGTRLSGMAQHFFRKKLPRTADLEVSYASAAAELELGLVCDGNNVVRHATRLQWKGATLDETPLRFVKPWLAEARDSMSGRVQEDAAGKRLLSIFPFRDGAGESVGVVVLSYDLTVPEAEATRFAMYEMVPQGMALLAGCLLIWGVMHLLVTRRVDDILAYAHAVSVGDAPPMPPLGDDELEAIGRGFGDAVGKVISTEASLLEAGELERQRIGRDLHDDVCQRISAAQMRIGVMGEALSAQGSPLAQTSREIEADLSAAAQIARGFARGLAPVALDTQGLDTAFMELAAFLERSFGVQCDLSCDEGMESLGAGVKTHLFRIAQELATNAAKHAQGSFIAIRLRGDEDGVELQVENDGKDFVETSGGLGLQFVRQRVRTLGGHMQIKKREGGLSGSVVVCTVPSQTHINLSPPIKRP